MLHTTLTSDANALTKALIDRQLTARDAATAANIDDGTFRALLRRDKKISLKTAGKLKKTFGDAAIKFISAQG